MDDLPRLHCDLVMAAGRHVFAALGVPDDGLRHVPHAGGFVLYVFASEQRASSAANAVCRLQAPVLAQYDQVIRPNCELRLGTGQAPLEGPSQPWKVLVLSDTGFVHDPLRVFEDAVDIVGSREWWAMPRVRGAGGEAAGIDEYELDRTYAPPRFSVPVIGHERDLQPWQWGRDKDKRRVRGWTWVRGHVKHDDLPDRPMRLDRELAIGARR